MGRVKAFFLFIWRMVSPLIVYELISEIVFAFLFFNSGYFYDPVIFNALGAIVALIPLTIWYNRWLKREEPRKRETPKYPLLLPEILKLAVLGMCLCVFLNILALYIPFTWQEYDSIGARIYTEPVFLQLIAVGLVIPLAEEMVFRGLGYDRMRTMLPAAWSMIASSVLFGLFHGNLIQGIYAGTLGLFMAAAMERYGTVMAPYVLHACANEMSVFLTNTIVNDLINYVIPFRIAALVVSGLIAVLVIMSMGKEEPFNEETVDDSGTVL